MYAGKVTELIITTALNLGSSRIAPGRLEIMLNYKCSYRLLCVKRLLILPSYKWRMPFAADYGRPME